MTPTSILDVPKLLKLTDFDILQNKTILNTAIAENLYKHQRHFIHEALAQGFADLHCTINPAQQILFHDYFTYLEKLVAGDFLTDPQHFSKEQQTLFEKTHTSNLSDQQKLFLEFLLGLARFDQATQLTFCFLANNTDENDSFNTSLQKITKARQALDLKNLTRYFTELANHTTLLINEVLKRTVCLQHARDYWREAHDFFAQHPHLKHIAKQLLSLQYIPLNVRFLSIAQTLHWQGMGGDGQFIEKFPVIAPLAIHSLGYHQQFHAPVNLLEKETVFKDCFKGLADVLHITKQALEICFPETSHYAIHDVCSGPNFAAIKPLCEAMPHKKFSLTLSDVDGSALAQLLKHQQQPPKNVTIDNVQYLDLNLPYQINQQEYNRYHLIGARIGLHQLTPENIHQALNAFTQIAKVGAIIVNPDIGRDAYLQVLVSPANIVDREGTVPDIENLTPLMCELDEQHYKLAYPLLNLAQVFPGEVGANTPIAMVKYHLYVVAKFPKKDIQALIQAWQAKQFEQCNQWVDAHNAGLVGKLNKII